MNRNESAEITEWQPESLEEKPEVKGKSSHFEAEGKLLRAENEFNDLIARQEQELDLLDQAAAQSKHPPETLKAALQKFQVFEHFRDIEKRAKRALDKLKRKAMFVFAASVMFQSLETEGLAQARQAKTALVEFSPEEESLRNNITLDMIRKDLMTEEMERVYVRGGNDKNYTEITSSPEKTRANIIYALANDTLRGRNKEIEIGHSHPVAAYEFFGYREKDIEAMRNAEQEPVPAPPSIIDLTSALGSQKYYGEKFMNAKWQVFDATGVWTFSFDEKTPKFKTWVKYMADVEKQTQKLAQKYVKVLEKKGLLHLTTQEINARVETDPDLQKIEDEQESEIDKLYEKHKWAMDALDEINVAQHQVANSGRNENPKKVIPERIQNYIRLCQEAGIVMVYSPYNQ